MTEEVSTATLREPGATKVEVLGGNHTRVALQSLNEKGLLKSPYVRMKVYKGLTDIEALQLGTAHNDVLKKSREMTFMEVCKLMRTLKPEIEEPTTIRSWKEDIMVVFNKKKVSEVSNNFKNHLKLCRSSKELWDLLVLVDQKWSDGLIKTTKGGSIQQTFYIKFFRLESEETQKDLLNVLMTEGQREFEDRVRKLQPGQRKEPETAEINREGNEHASGDERLKELHKIIDNLKKKNHDLKTENQILKKKNEALGQALRKSEIAQASQSSTESEDESPSHTSQRSTISEYKSPSKGMQKDETGVSRQKKRQIEESLFQEGVKVDAFWKDTNKDLEGWYENTTIIKKESNDRYLIQYADGVKKTVPRSWLRQA